MRPPWHTASLWECGKYALWKASHRATRVLRRAQDRHIATRFPGFVQRGALAPHFEAVPVDLLTALREPILELAEWTAAGRFDLLGSGWRSVAYGVECPGVEGVLHRAPPVRAPDPEGEWQQERVVAAHRPRSLATWRLVSPDHVPIDWQRDFKSGWRYDERVWSEDLCIDGPAGADVKVPWELARMQHLPWLALAYRLCTSGGRATDAERFRSAFRDQVLDFIATNPPRFGVNWRGSMEAAIRVVNWLVAYDLFRSAGAVFDDAFDITFARSVFVHASHVAGNLEWHPVLKGNHYLCGLAGLAISAAYLPSTRTTRGWLARAWNGLLRETREQFLDDGANFESSTSYHRLSAETVVYVTAFMVSTLRSRPDHAAGLTVPAAHMDRVVRMRMFTDWMTGLAGRVPQIGDNDSGRFLKLVPTVHGITVVQARNRYRNLHEYRDLPDDTRWWDEDFLDHRQLSSAIATLSGSTLPPSDVSAECRLQQSLIRCVTTGDALMRTTNPLSAADRYGDYAAWTQGDTALAALRERQKRSRRFQWSAATTPPHVVRAAFPLFGAFVFRAVGLHLVVRCGPVGQRGWGAHAHNDQLSMSLEIDGVQILSDPGTFLYTPSAKERNRYRSAAAHNGPRLNTVEPGDLEQGLFRLQDRAHARCLYFGERGFLGMHEGFGVPVFRRIAFDGGEIVVDDWFDGSPDRLSDIDWAEDVPPPPFSPKYGFRNT
jgi:hypothetical protein